MDYKNILEQNAWFGVNMDFGLLHFQFATPFVVLIFILIMLYALNRLFFQPVLKTLDLRKKQILKSSKQTINLNEQIGKLEAELQTSIKEVKLKISKIHEKQRIEGQNEKERMINDQQKILESEIDIQIESIKNDLEKKEEKLKKFTVELSEKIFQQLTT